MHPGRRNSGAQKKVPLWDPSEGLNRYGGGPEAVIRELKPGRVLVDHGPVTLVIVAEREGRPDTVAAMQGGQKALSALAELARVKDAAFRRASELEESRYYPAVLNRMIRAVQRVGETDLTCMAAVAGAIADEAVDAAFRAGATRVAANNGGDIALRFGSGQSMRIGIIEDMQTGRCSRYVLASDGNGIRGVATSGFGGRSLTQGIASAAVAISSDAALADACATVLGNATNAESPLIRRVPAETKDPGTDIRGIMVTDAVGELPAEVKRAALTAGLEKARALIDKGLIIGAFLAVGDLAAMLPEGIALPLSGGETSSP